MHYLHNLEIRSLRDLFMETLHWREPFTERGLFADRSSFGQRRCRSLAPLGSKMCMKFGYKVHSSSRTRSVSDCNQKCLQNLKFRRVSNWIRIFSSPTRSISSRRKRPKPFEAKGTLFRRWVSCLANQSSIANELIIRHRWNHLNKVIKHNRLIKWIFLHN